MVKKIPNKYQAIIGAILVLILAVIGLYTGNTQVQINSTPNISIPVVQDNLSFNTSIKNITSNITETLNISNFTSNKSINLSQ